MRTPASVYETSWRPYPAVVSPPEYDREHATRTVTPNGRLHWKGHDFFLSKVLGGELVGLRELDEGRWTIEFGPVFLAVLDLRSGEVRLSFRRPVSSAA